MAPSPPAPPSSSVPAIPVLIERPESELPPPYRDALDPQKPLVAGVRFLKQDGHVSMAAAWAMGLFLGAFGLVMILGVLVEALKLWGKGSPSPAQAAIYGLIFLGGIPLVLQGLRGVRKEQQLLAEAQRDDFRYGLFLFPDALLVRLHGQPCSLVPRARIEKVSHLNAMQGGDWIAIQLRAQGTDERKAEPAYANIPGSLGPLLEARQAITEWLR